MTKNIRRLSQNQMEEILQKVSENLTVQFPNYNRAEYDQALIDLKNYQDRLNAIGDHVQGIKRIDQVEEDKAPIIDFNKHPHLI